MKFRKRPVVIEARQITGSTVESFAVYQWVEANTAGSFEPYTTPPPTSGVSIDPGTGNMLIATLEGVMQAAFGDWIIRGVEGEFYPCKPAIFEATYEPVEERDRNECDPNNGHECGHCGDVWVEP